MKETIFLFCLFFSACTGSRLMTYERYQEVSLGENIAEVQLAVGHPYEVKALGPGRQAYVFIERIGLGNGREVFRKYILVVEGSKVVEKRIEEETSTALQLHG